MADRCSLAIRSLGELASNFFIVALDFMTKEKLEGKLRAAYRLVLGVVGHDRRACTKWSHESFHAAWGSLVGEHALMYDGESTRRFSNGGKSVSTDLVDEAYSLGQGHIVAVAVGWRRSTATAYVKARLTPRRKCKKQQRKQKEKIIYLQREKQDREA